MISFLLLLSFVHASVPEYLPELERVHRSLIEAVTRQTDHGKTDPKPSYDAVFAPIIPTLEMIQRLYSIDDVWFKKALENARHSKRAAFADVLDVEKPLYFFIRSERPGSTRWQTSQVGKEIERLRELIMLHTSRHYQYSDIGKKVPAIILESRVLSRVSANPSIKLVFAQIADSLERPVPPERDPRKIHHQRLVRAREAIEAMNAFLDLNGLECTQSLVPPNLKVD